MASPRRPSGQRARRMRNSLFITFGLMFVTFLQILRHRSFTDEQFLESRHPLGTRRMGAPMPQQSIKGELRYLTFGSSTTWGVGLEDFRLAYPYRLSSRVRNAASRMGGSALAAACTETIVGNDVFDVATIEFDRFDESHSILSKRLRLRFPNMLIVFVQLWKPDDIMYISDDGHSMSFNTWRVIYGKGHSLHSSELALLMMEAGPSNWRVRVENERLLTKTVQQLDARILTLPMPDKEAFSFPQNLLSFLGFFNDDDSSTLTARGHAAIAAEVRKMVTTHEASKSGSDRTAFGNWESGDHCNLWYYNGRYPPSDGQKLKFSPAEDGTHKHALEFRVGGGASIRVHNKFDKARMLYLTYMTAPDEEYDKVYPRTRVRVNNRAYVVLEPYHEKVNSGHLTRTSGVGLIPPGDSIIHLDPLETSRLYFRLVGASILNEEAVNSNIHMDFELEPEPALTH